MTELHRAGATNDTKDLASIRETLMARAATSRLKVNPPLGLMPALQYLLPAQLEIDESYQRNLETGPSQSLVRRIAMFWNWDLCQPLVIARRENGALFVIDGQHRLAAARLRGDIAQLPAVVVQYASAADEAASFVHLNQQRRPLGKLDIFKAAVASGDGQAMAISQALAEAGLSVASTTNSSFWKPAQLINIGGIEASWRSYGSAVTRTALRAIAEGLAGQILRYAGTIFPGVAAVCADQMPPNRVFDPDLYPLLVEMIGGCDQDQWRKDVALRKVSAPNMRFSAAAEAVFRDAWAELLAELTEDVAA